MIARLATLTVLFTSFSAPAGDWKAAVAKHDPPADLAEAVRGLLDTNAVTVSDGQPFLTLWFRAAVPAKATAEQVKNGLTYREIADGTLVGAIRFERTFVDFRKQEVPAGVYTLRFAVQPETGDHMGTAPHQEFLLLVPAAKDREPDPLEPKTLYKASAAVTGGDHPGVLLLFPNNGANAGPTIATRPGNVSVALMRRTVEVESGKSTLGFAIAVAGHSPTR